MFWPPNVTFFQLKLLLDNSASSTSSRMEDLCQKWKVKVFFSTGGQEAGLLSVWKSLGACNLKQFDGLTWLTLTPRPRILRQIYATDNLNINTSQHSDALDLWFSFTLIFLGSIRICRSYSSWSEYQSINQSINQSKRIYIAPTIMSQANQRRIINAQIYFVNWPWSFPLHSPFRAYQFIIRHSVTLSLRSQNLSVPQILSTVDSWYLPDCPHGLLPNLYLFLLTYTAIFRFTCI